MSRPTPRDEAITASLEIPLDPRQRELAYDPAERHFLVQAFVERFLPPLYREIDTAIANGDEMWGFAVNEQYQHRGLALVAYLRSGWLAWEALEQVLRWRFGELHAVGRLLDVASGFGRMTRFLVAAIPEQRVYVSEINAAALDFQAARFGVAPLASPADPATFACDRRFDCVNVFSLFTHLPEPRFRGWLARLWELVLPGGVLVFSTNGPEIAPADRRPPDDGIRFDRVSEIAGLPLEDYGSTWVGERFVRAAVAASCPGASGCLRFERALWACQDLWVVARGDSAFTDPRAPLRLELEPLAWLDAAHLESADVLAAHGWAIDRENAREPVTIRVEADGHEIGTARATLPRPDIARVHGVLAERAGWEARCLAPAPEEPGLPRAFDPAAPLLVTATAASGRIALVHLSAIEGADLRQRAAGSLEEIRFENLGLRNVIAGLEARIAAMEASRFWRLRNAWWRLRRAVGLGEREPS
jgi:SAM-dependent methyltransferase